MSQGNTSTSFGALLKQYYTDEVVADSTYDKNPLLAMLPKSEDITGSYYNVPVIYGQGQGRSAVFTTAQNVGAVDGTAVANFQVPLVQNWEDATISSQLILQSGNDRGAFLKAATQVTDGQLKNLALDLEISLFGDGSGARGVISASTTIASPTISFVNPKSALNFEVGMRLDLAAASETGSLRALAGGAGVYPVVGSVNRIAGSITLVNAAGAAININNSSYGWTSPATGDVLFQAGDQGLKMYGLQSWLPYGGPASNDSFTNSGVNRSLDNVRLAGLYMNGAGLSTEECLIKAAAAVSEQGDDVTHFFMNFPKFAALASSLSSKVQITNVMMTPTVGFRYIEIMGPSGPIKVVPSRACPATNIFGLKLSEWELVSVRKAVFVWDLDGRDSLRQGSDSGLEMRFMSFSNLVCHKPSANINVQVASA